MPFELRNGLWLPSAKVKGEEEITIFLDESYDEKQQVVYVVAGYIGAAPNWANFSSEWQAVMSDAGCDGVVFHTSPFEHGGEEPWKSLKQDVERRHAMLNGLLDVIRKNALYPFGAMVLLDEYVEGKERLKLTCNDPYELCVEFALFAAEEMCEVAEGGSIKFVCDENQKCAKSVLFAFNDMKKMSQRFGTVFGDLKFGSDEVNIELCAADLLAFEVRRHVYNSLRAPGVQMRYPLKRIITDGPSRFLKVDFSNIARPIKIIRPN